MSNKAPKHTACLIDDDAGIRNSLRMVMKDADIAFVSFTSAQDFLANFDPAAIACILLDHRMPGMTGLELLSVLRERHVAVPVIILTGHADVPLAVQSMQGGAVDVVEKPYKEFELLDKIQQAFNLFDSWQRAALDREVIRSRIERLTRREKGVLDCMVAGKKNKDIAVELDISPKTLDIHRSKVMEKMEARTVADLVRWRLFEQSPIRAGTAGWLA